MHKLLDLTPHHFIVLLLYGQSDVEVMAYSNEIDENKSMPKEIRKLYRGIGFLHDKDLIR